MLLIDINYLQLSGYPLECFDMPPGCHEMCVASESWSLTLCVATMNLCCYCGLYCGRNDFNSGNLINAVTQYRQEVEAYIYTTIVLNPELCIIMSPLSSAQGPVCVCHL